MEGIMTDTDVGRNEKDARLIAAAPDMYRALREIIGMSGPNTAGMARRVARDALAKVEEPEGNRRGS